jgi:formate dehydrogenase assembly factor FdhD
MTAKERSIARTERIAVRAGVTTPGSRALPEEVPVALSFGGTTQAVMMATPQDLEDFGVGFALSEAIARSANDIASLDVVESDQGFDVQMQLAGDLQAGTFRSSPQDGWSRGLRALRDRIHRRGAAPASGP